MRQFVTQALARHAHQSPGYGIRRITVVQLGGNGQVLTCSMRFVKHQAGQPNTLACIVIPAGDCISCL